MVTDEKRQLGDYEYTFVMSKTEAEEVLESGRKFVDESDILRTLTEFLAIV